MTDIRVGPRPAPPRPASLDAAYAALAKALASEPPPAGWKLGGTNWASRAAFGMDRLWFGPLAAHEVLSTPTRAPGLPLAELKGEAEIALRIAPEGAATPWDAWRVALETPSSLVPDMAAAGVATLVADRCSAGSLLLGPPEPAGALVALENGAAGSRFAIEIDGREAAVGALSDLTDAPSACLAAFLAEARSRGFHPRPGDWVATGGITPCIDLPEGARARVLLGDEPRLDIRVSRTAADA